MEFITYDKGAKLVPHIDSGSTYTFTVTISADFEGGYFRIRDEDDGAWITMATTKGDAILFDSEITHYVTEVRLYLPREKGAWHCLIAITLGALL